MKPDSEKVFSEASESGITKADQKKLQEAVHRLLDKLFAAGVRKVEISVRSWKQ